MAVKRSYAERLERNFYSRTNEKEILSRVLERLLDGPTIEHALDVGPGPGALTSVLDKRSARLTLVEPDEAYEETLRSRFPNARLIVGSVADVELPSELDAILLSHVLYYLPADRWTPLCRRLANALRPGGLMIAILTAPAGDWWRVVNRFWEPLRSVTDFDYRPLPSLTEDLRDLGDVQLSDYEFDAHYDDARQMATAFGEQILQIVDATALERESERFVELAEEICARNGEPVLRNRGQVLTLKRR